MSEKRTPTELLQGAYEIETPEDSRAYYHDFADHYDAEFAQKLGYIYPRVIAEFYHKTATPQDRPIADIGCGTGLVAEALNLTPETIHGFDISPEMLGRSRDKGLYGALHNVDLTAPLAVTAPSFGAVVSAGTFTHGHLGPEPLENLLTLARAGALFCIGVNAQHFAAQGFAAVLDRLQAAGKITAPILETVPIYSDPNSAHGKDKAQVLIYRKAPD
nr:methyltransferase domain-containing protein [Amylibacter sp.]